MDKKDMTGSFVSSEREILFMSLIAQVFFSSMLLYQILIPIESILQAVIILILATISGALCFVNYQFRHGAKR